MKYLIVGLGNIGREYENTRHNIGFKVVEAFAKEEFEDKRYGFITKTKYKGRVLVLLKPSTYMNLSGKAINYWLQKEKISIDNLLIITDDLALPFGSLRMRGKGSDGGHNGLKSINQILGTTKYARLRFGIGDEFSKGNQVNYVLSEWSSAELEPLEERIQSAIKFIQGFCTIGINRTMSELNGK